MTAVPAPTALAGPGRRGWIQSPAWDLFWMFSALWGAALLLAASAVSPLVALVALVFLLQRLVSVLHSWSTTYMVLFSPLLTEERRANPRKYVVWPAALAALALALGLVVASSVRYPPDGRVTWALWPFALYLGLFWVGHFWHFGNQDFGVLTLYRAKAGQDRLLDRRVDKLFTSAMMFVIQPVVYLSVVTTTAVSEMVHTALPFWTRIQGVAPALAVAAAVALALGVAAFELSKPNRSIPKLLYIAVCLMHPTVLYAAVQTHRETLALLYLFSYLWSHWLIAVGLVGRINARHYQSRGDPPALGVLRHAAVLGAIAGLVFLATERHKDYLLFTTDGLRYKDLLAAIPPEQTLVVGLVLGFFLAEQLVHYYCDRCLFRFRDPGIRRRVGPLLLGDAGR